MILVGYRHECAPPGVNRVSYDALADPLAWAACAPGKKRSPAPRLVLVNPSAQCVVNPGVTRITVFAFVTERGCARCANDMC
jgi:hypothetical protein